MYAPFFGLRQEPFSIAPDPRFLFMSGMHREALAHLLYGLGAGGGFVLLTGEIGAGKTTVCRCFLEQVPPQHHVAYIFNPRVTVTELLQTICEEFHVTVAPGATGGTKPWIDALNHFMLQAHAAGHNCVLIIDEAQNLAADVLEQLRLLTNLETAERKLLQIILIGQPELRDLLASPALEQLAQRIVARYHLGALTAAETADYVRHRLAVAGQGGALPFDAGTLQLVHRLTGGVPRRINLLCDRALLGAYSREATRVDRRTVQQAAGEVFGGHRRPAVRRGLSRGAWVALAGIAALAIAGLVLVARQDEARPAASATPPAASVPARAASSAASAASASNAGPASLDLASVLQPDEAKAWRALARRWGSDLPDDAGDPCTAVRATGLACHRGTADLATLRQLDRPVLLLLAPEGGAAGRPAVLLALTDREATLSTATGPQPVPLDVLTRAWSGEFATLWRPPPDYRDPVIDRAASPAGEWLLMQLTRLQGDAPALNALRGDEALRQRVFAFQARHGLRLDGLAGPLTLMHVNHAAGVDEPRLSAPR